MAQVCIATPTENTPETSKVGTPLFSRHFRWHQWCPHYRASTVICYCSGDNYIDFWTLCRSQLRKSCMTLMLNVHIIVHGVAWSWSTKSLLHEEISSPLQCYMSPGIWHTSSMRVPLQYHSKRHLLYNMLMLWRQFHWLLNLYTGVDGMHKNNYEYFLVTMEPVWEHTT